MKRMILAGFNIAQIVVIIIFSVICFDQIFRLFGYGTPPPSEKGILWRTPHPYDMFRGKPLALDHNEFGFRGPSIKASSDKEEISIAFLGGSTGYMGEPPIPSLLSTMLTNKGKKNKVFNFSSVSSNHTQHLHRLIEFLEYPFDMVIFYGGGQ